MILKNQKTKRILSIIAIILISVLLLNFFATKIVYDSIFRRQDKEQAILQKYSALINSREEITFTSGDNSLMGYYYQGAEEETLIIVTPGYSAGADDYLGQIDCFLQEGYGVFAFDPTGCYKSEGSSAIGFPQTVLDLRAALDYLAIEDNFGYEDIILFGHSRGGYASACIPHFGYEISAIISVSGADSAMSGVMETSVSYAGKVAYLNYPFLWAYQVMLFDADILNLSAHKIISENRIPTLIIHSDSDTQIPKDSGSIIAYESEISNSNAKFILYKNDKFSGHTRILKDRMGNPNEELMLTITDFINSNRNEVK